MSAVPPNFAAAGGLLNHPLGRVLALFRAPRGFVYLAAPGADRSGSGSGRMQVRPVAYRAHTVPGSLLAPLTAWLFPSQPNTSTPLYNLRRRRIYSKLAAGHGLVNTPLQFLSNPVSARSTYDPDGLWPSLADEVAARRCGTGITPTQPTPARSTN